jgi:hypothetical protein
LPPPHFQDFNFLLFCFLSSILSSFLNRDWNYLEYIHRRFITNYKRNQKKKSEEEIRRRKKRGEEKGRMIFL